MLIVYCETTNIGLLLDAKEYSLNITPTRIHRSFLV